MEIEPKNQRRNFRSEKFVCSHFLAEWKTALKFPKCQSRKGNFLLYPHIKVIGLTNLELIISNYQSKFYEFF